jgi:hypothetical protein
VYTRCWWGNLRDRDLLKDLWCRWDNDNNKMDPQEVGCEGLDWVDPTHDMYRWLALVNAVMNLRIQ